MQIKVVTSREQHRIYSNIMPKIDKRMKKIKRIISERHCILHLRKLVIALNYKLDFQHAFLLRVPQHCVNGVVDWI